MGLLIDSSVLIEWERAGVHLGSVAELRDQSVAISAITASELLHGVHRADSARRRAGRLAFVEGMLQSMPVLPVDLEVARVHSELWADLRRRGQLIGAHDLLIAATAIAHELAVLTGDARDFRRVEGLEVRQV